ncbi:MAG: hypothetical protein HY854_19310 [Burkholderiales bacterium]|nr:hypothetical protein [Burkholderiales bacterium]
MNARDRRLAASGAAVKPESWMAQAGAIAAWDMGKDGALPRLAEITSSVLVANGANNIMLHACNSFGREVAGFLG